MPSSTEPTSAPRERLQAALSVAAVSASSIDSRSSKTASVRIIGIDSVNEEPGLQSVASATGTPASTSRRAGAQTCFMRKNEVPGSSTAVTPAAASASIPCGETAIRWSAESAPSSAASAAAPESTNSSAWRRGSRPCRAPAASTRRDSSTVKTPCSQKTSQNRARPASAAAGTISSQTRSR